MTILYTSEHARKTGYLRTSDPEQYFRLLSQKDTSRPLIVPKEYLIHFDNFLLPCNIPTQIVTPLTFIKHHVSSLLDEKVKSHYTVLSKQPHS